MLSMKHIFSILAFFALFSHAHSFPYEKIVVFGDSLTDDGSGVYSLTGGQLPLPPYYHGRFSNGPVWTEYLAQTFHLDYKRHVTNYAYGGALVSLEGPTGSPPALMATINDYLISRKFNLSSSDEDKTLYIIEGGANDVFVALEAGALTNQTREQTLIETLPGLVHFITERIVSAGGRHVVVFKLAPLYISPYLSSLSPETLEKIKNLTLDLVDLITVKITNLRSSLDVDIQLYDPSDLWLDAYENPEKYGFKNSTGNCLQNWIDFLYGHVTPGEQAIECKEPNEYLFWDGFHPTTKFHELWAHDIEEKLGWQ